MSHHLHDMEAITLLLILLIYTGTTAPIAKPYQLAPEQ